MNDDAITRRGPDKKTWYVVEQVPDMTSAEVVAGLLRSAGIPVFLFREAINTALPLMYGPLGGVEVAVPEAYYDEAMTLLGAEDEDLDELPPETGEPFAPDP